MANYELEESGQQVLEEQDTLGNQFVLEEADGGVLFTDTKTKRFSMMHLFGGFCPLPSVTDGSITVKDRFSFLSLYTGIADTETITATGYVYKRSRTHDAIAKRKRLGR